MPTIVYITPDGKRHEVDVENGYSVMEGAINNNIDGIVAECGGACSCATCHVYVDAAWTERTGAPDAMAASAAASAVLDMLKGPRTRFSTSMMSCGP